MKLIFLYSLVKSKNEPLLDKLENFLKKEFQEIIKKAWDLKS